MFYINVFHFILFFNRYRFYYADEPMVEDYAEKCLKYV